MDMSELGQRGLRDSEAWFPDLHTTSTKLITHFALGLAGECGELVNLIKKANRHGPILDHLDRQAVAHEIADVLIYALDIAAAIGIDPSEAIESKRAVLIERWGDPDCGGT